LPRGDNRPLLGLTAVDSGEFCPSPEDERNGWQAVDGIAYSRRLDSVDALPQDCCCTACGHYDEWYLFTTDPPRLGAIFCVNPVYRGRGHRQGVPLRQLLRFRFSESAYAYEVALLWQQLDWTRPESYLAGGDQCLPIDGVPSK
jgi:hypothetical protein